MLYAKEYQKALPSSPESRDLKVFKGLRSSPLLDPASITLLSSSSFLTQIKKLGGKTSHLTLEYAAILLRVRYYFLDVLLRVRHYFWTLSTRSTPELAAASS